MVPLTIGVVIPLYNGAKFIAEALHSVLAQTLSPSEIIVVDDGSTDQGAEVVERVTAQHPVTLLRKQNGGQSSARNFGIARSGSDIIALLDQDDLWYPDHLARLAEPFSDSFETPLGWVYSNLDEIDERGQMVARKVLSGSDIVNPKKKLNTCLGQDMFILPSASLISRSAFDHVGGFDENLSGYEDDDLFLRLFRAGFANVYIDEALSQWRIYRSSSSFSPRMARSRRTYANKLIDLYPDDPSANRYYTRDLIAPRFYRQMAEEYRKALVANRDALTIQAARDDLEFIKQYLIATPTQDLASTSLTISTIIPLYNGAKYIEEALRSVLAQTLMPTEIIVVDDGSTDNGGEIVEKLAIQFPIKLLRKNNGGQSSARNFGVAQSGGELIALLDQDDIWYPTHLERLVQPFLEGKSKDLGWVYSNLDEIDEAGRSVTNLFLSTVPAKHPKRDLSGCLDSDMFVLPSASLISRSAFDHVGGFDETLSGYEDDDLFLRLFRAGFANAYIDEALSQWRIYLSSSSFSPRMAKSRRIYANKLIDLFPDDPSTNRYYTRDLIAPRFYRQMADEYRKVLVANRDARTIQTARDDLEFIKGHLIAAPSREVAPASLTISTIIPLYNGAKYIEEALRSVLAQTLMPTEIIVIDDGSTDNGGEIVRKLAVHFPIKLLRKENGGQSSARNLGVARSGGELIALLDQDDTWYPTHLEQLIQPFLKPRSKDLGWVYSNLDEIDEAGRSVTNSFLSTIPAKHPKRDLSGCLGSDMFVLPSASLISRKAFDAVGGFDERLSGYEDDDFFLSVFRAGFDNVYLDAALSKWRIYPTSSSYSSRMSRSRVLYARKLFEQYPDDPTRERFYTRDLIAPRFLGQMLGDYRKAGTSTRRGSVAACKADLKFIGQFLRLKTRLTLWILLAIGPLGRFLLNARGMRPVHIRQFR